MYHSPSGARRLWTPASLRGPLGSDAERGRGASSLAARSAYHAVFLAKAASPRVHSLVSVPRTNRCVLKTFGLNAPGTPFRDCGRSWSEGPLARPFNPKYEGGGAGFRSSNFVVRRASVAVVGRKRLRARFRRPQAYFKPASTESGRLVLEI